MGDQSARPAADAAEQCHAAHLALEPDGRDPALSVIGPPGCSVTDLKTIQDLVLERSFKAVPGVIDVNGWGGQIVNIGSQAAVVRGVGLIHSMDQIRDTMLSASNGTRVLRRDAATVQVSNWPRLVVAGHDDEDDIVQGIVLMRRGELSLPTIKHVEADQQQVQTPGGDRLEWAGEFGELQEAIERLALVVPLSLVLICVLLYMNFSSLVDTLLAASVMPMALVGGIFALYITARPSACRRRSGSSRCSALPRWTGSSCSAITTSWSRMGYRPWTRFIAPARCKCGQ